MIAKTYFVIKNVGELVETFLASDKVVQMWTTKLAEAKSFLTAQDTRDFLEAFDPLEPCEVSIEKVHSVKNR